MPTSLQKKLEILQRRKAVAARYLRGHTQWEIARALEVTQKCVSTDLAAIRAEWLQAAVADFGARQAEELARLDLVEGELWAAWGRSQQPREQSRARTRTGKAAGSETELRKEQRSGNPKFLEIVVRCVELRCKITGVIRDRKDDPPPPSAGDVVLDQLGVRTDAPKEVVAQILDLRRKLLGLPQRPDGAGGAGQVTG